MLYTIYGLNKIYKNKKIFNFYYKLLQIKPQIKIELKIKTLINFLK